ncbi:MAG: LysR family transcriptional regulator [Deltaproteobacteria bacterium]|nr:LysR family transcriptional regulator [Deltaproteobacteria bacterium]
MNWDDLRYVLALSAHGSLARTAKTLGVDHTTVGRRVEQAERALGVRLFTRTSTGYVPTADAERLLSDLRGVEDAVIGLERSASARKSAIDGTVRVTSPETFGCLYLAPRLATLRREHPGLSIELHSTGKVLDLARREADVAVRMFRSAHESLVVKRVGSLGYGLYASKDYLARRPLKRASELREHALLSSEAGPGALDAKWLERLSHGAKPALVCDLSMALLEACRASAGVAVLPRYVGDREPSLVHLTAALGAIPEAPTETIWITVHKDMRDTPRVRVVLDHLAKAIAADATLLVGR